MTCRGTAAGLAAAVWLLLGALLAVAPPAAAADRNVLLLIADDLGVDVAEFYPTPAERRVTDPPAPPMPNLRRLAQRGVLFTNAWSDPTCTPTRATIFTGRYGFRTGVGRALPLVDDPTLPGLAVSEFGLPEALATRPRLSLAHVGKWHLSYGRNDPNRHGWPYAAGLEPGDGSVAGYTAWTKVVNGVARPSTAYATSDTVDEALAAIGRARGEGRPFVVWAAFNAPHAPYHKPPANLHTRRNLPASVGGAGRRPHYEAMIEALDTEVGRLLAGIDLTDTTVIFLGDNGTSSEVTVGVYHGRQAKGGVYQTGIRIPLLVAGAGVANPGRLADGLVNTVDLFPTILELAGVDPAAVVPAGTRTDGVSLTPYLTDRAGGSLRSFAYAEQFYRGVDDQYQRAIRDARHKLIERADGSRELYDLRADPLERTNLLRGRLSAAQQRALRALDRELDALLASR